MEYQKRNMLKGWYDKATKKLEAAKRHLNTKTENSEAIQAAQECIELSVKSILSILNIEYSKTHGWEETKGNFLKIAKQISDKDILKKLSSENLGHIRLPRLIMLANFWSQFYLTAKYGFSVSNLAPAKDLFDYKEAELSVAHADECLYALRNIIYLPDDKLKKLE